MDERVIPKGNDEQKTSVVLQKSPLKKGISKKKISMYVFICVFLAWPMIQFSIFYVYMNFNNIMLAFKGMNVDGSTYWNGLNNFKNVLFGLDVDILTICLKNNFAMFFWTTIIGMPLNMIFAFYLYKKKWGSSVIRIVYMLPNMVSGVVITLLFMKFVEVGLPIVFPDMPNLIKNNDTAFIMQIVYTLWLGFSTSIIIYSNAMYAVDEGMVEAAHIDGASNIQELLLIIIPNIMPTISTYVITGVSGILSLSGSLYLFYGLSNVPKNAYMMGYYLFKIAMVGDLTAYPQAAAISVLITVCTIPITFLVRWLLNRFDPLRDVYAKEG